MRVFYVFQIVQMVLNRATHLIFYNWITLTKKAATNQFFLVIRFSAQLFDFIILLLLQILIPWGSCLKNKKLDELKKETATYNLGAKNYRKNKRDYHCTKNVFN